MEEDPVREPARSPSAEAQDAPAEATAGAGEPRPCAGGEFVTLSDLGGESAPGAADAARTVSPAAPMAPVSPGERIEFIDVLRGVALFGILAANMRAFAAPSAAYGHIHLLFPGFADRFVQGLLDTFVSTKFITLFAFLFGLGFAVQITRAQARGVRVGSFYPRRLLVLLAIGVVHGALIWWGDILVAYAAMGFVLLAFRNRQPRTLLRWAGGIFAAELVLLTVVVVVSQVRGPRPSRPHPGREPQELARVVEVYRAGDPAGIAVENFRAWTEYLAKDASVLVFLPTFLFGLWVWRRGIVQDLEGHRQTIARACRLALPLGLAVSTFTAAVGRLRPEPVPEDPLWLATTACAFYGTPLLSLGYATGLALLVRRAVWHRRLAPFAAVGRMALTNYVMQSVVCVPFFVATGLYGRVGPALALLPTVALYSFQVWLSNRWLERYRFGPLEWLWRSLTYGRLGPLRRAGAGEPAAV